MEANLNFGRWDFGTAWHRGSVPYAQSRAFFAVSEDPATNVYPTSDGKVSGVRFTEEVAGVTRSDTMCAGVHSSIREGFPVGNIIFIVLHIVAVLFGFWMLIITIPAHLIFLAIGGRGATAPTADTHRRCVMCAELILKDAIKCKHCGHVHETSATEAERAELRARSDRAASVAAEMVRDAKALLSRGGGPRKPLDS